MRIDHRTREYAGAFQRKQERGFTMIELMVVCIVLVIISVIAIPNIAQINANYKLDAAGHSVASLLQQARMQAVKTNVPAYAKFDTASGMSYVVNDPSSSFTTGIPDVSVASGLSFQTAIPNSSFHEQLDTYVGATAGSPAQIAATIGFNARGLPCIPGANPVVCPSSTSGFEWFVQNASGGWEAITVTPAGRIKSWRMSRASGGTNECGYAACWQ